MCRTRWTCWASVSLGIHWNQERTQILVVQCQKKGIGIHQKTTDPTNLCYSLHRSWEIMAHHQTFYSDTEHVMLAVVFKCPFYTHFPWHTNQINQILIIDQTRQTADFKNDPSGEDIFCYLLLCLKVADIFEHAGTSKMEQRPRTSSGRRLELHCALHHHLPNTPSQKNPPTLPASLHVFFQPCRHASIHLQTPTGVCSRCFACRMRLEPRQQTPNPVFAATVNI